HQYNNANPRHSAPRDRHGHHLHPDNPNYDPFSNSVVDDLTDWARRLATSDRSSGAFHHQDRRRSSQILDDGILDRDYSGRQNDATTTTNRNGEGGYGRSVGQILLDNGYGGWSSSRLHQGQANEGYGAGNRTQGYGARRPDFEGGFTDRQYSARDRGAVGSTGVYRDGGPGFNDVRYQGSGRMRDRDSPSASIAYQFHLLLRADSPSSSPILPTHLAVNLMALSAPESVVGARPWATVATAMDTVAGLVVVVRLSSHPIIAALLSSWGE
ncbi:MAG: hypothetical protein M1830_009370, partial [Pleopsidium flavum]